MWQTSTREEGSEEQNLLSIDGQTYQWKRASIVSKIMVGRETTENEASTMVSSCEERKLVYSTHQVPSFYTLCLR